MIALFSIMGTVIILVLAHYFLEQAGKMGIEGMRYMIQVSEISGILIIIMALFSEHVFDIFNRFRGVSSNGVSPPYVAKHFLIIGAAIIFSIAAISYVENVIPSTKVFVIP